MAFRIARDFEYRMKFVDSRRCDCSCTQEIPTRLIGDRFLLSPKLPSPRGHEQHTRKNEEHTDDEIHSIHVCGSRGPDQKFYATVGVTSPFHSLTGL